MNNQIKNLKQLTKFIPYEIEKHRSIDVDDLEDISFFKKLLSIKNWSILKNLSLVLLNLEQIMALLIFMEKQNIDEIKKLEGPPKIVKLGGNNSSNSCPFLQFISSYIICP